jgi:hypothetical protein
VNIAQLRQTIVSLLSATPNLIGSYVLPRRHQDSCYLCCGTQEGPNGMASGRLEVTMREFPERLPRAGVGIVDVLQQWEVVLVQYNTAGAELSSAMDRMTRRFPDATFRYLPGDDIAYERCRIIIPDRQVKNLIR